MTQKFPFEHFLSFNVNNTNNFNELDKNIDVEKSLNEQEIHGFSSEELISVTETLKSELKKALSPEKFETFFANHFTVSSINNDNLYIKVSNILSKTMYEKHYIGHIKEAIKSLLGKDYNVIVGVMNSENTLINKVDDKKDYEIIKAQTVKESGFKLQESTEIFQVKSPQYQQNPLSVHFGQKIDKSKTFDNFIVGPSNNMAHAFAFSVAKNPGTLYPQLYLYGNSGLGKTHLLHSICNHISNSRPELRIIFISANAFVSEMVNSIQQKKDYEFRKKYSDNVDVLIIDDIHELKDKERTQMEFFHIFNELQSKGKQLIFTSDKAPKEIYGIEERIKTRLSSALLTEIQQPDLETRIAILKEKANEKDIFLDDEIINFIATHVKSNIRELEGNLIRLHAYSNLMKVDIDLETAKAQLGLTQETNSKELTLETIAKAVSQYFKIPIGDLKGKSRVKQITHARHAGMYITYKLLKSPLAEIGNFYGKRDHTTVMNAVNKFRELRDDDQLQRQLYEIESLI